MVLALIRITQHLHLLFTIPHLAIVDHIVHSLPMSTITIMLHLPSLPILGMVVAVILLA